MLISSNFASQTRWWLIFALGPQMHQAAPNDIKLVFLVILIFFFLSTKLTPHLKIWHKAAKKNKNQKTKKQKQKQKKKKQKQKQKQKIVQKKNSKVAVNGNLMVLLT